MKNLKQYINIPNILSFYRLISFPIVLYFALNSIENIFVILLVINLITDALDGIIARLFNLETEFGAKLDAYADIGMYITAIIGIIVFKSDDLSPHYISLYIFVFVFILPKIISSFRFKRFPSLHLYSSKIGGYMQGAFFFVLFVFGFKLIFYYIVIVFGIITFIEQTVILLITPKLNSNVKGLYWVLKDRKWK